MIFFRRSPDYDPNWDLTLSMRFRQWTSGWRGVVVLTILVGWAVSAWKGDDIYTWVKVRRAEGLIAEADAARSRGDFSGVAEKLKQAMALLQYHPATLRAVARYQLDMKQLSGLNTYQRLMESGEATQADRVTFAREAFRLGRADLAAGVLEELRANPETRDSAVVLALQAASLAGQGEWAGAVKQAREACAVQGGDESGQAYAKAVLARLLLQPPQTARAEAEALIREGIDLLTELALRRDGEGLETLEILVMLAQDSGMAPFLAGREAQGLLEAAEAHPQASARLKVGLWSVLLAAEPGRRGEITQALFERAKAGESPVMRLEAARWLNQRRMHRQALELAKPAKLESEEWFLVYLDASAALGDWDEVIRSLGSRETVPLSPALRRLFELRAEMTTGAKQDVEAAWREIELAAREEKPKNLLYMAGYAEQIGFPGEASRFYRKLLEVDTQVQGVGDKLNRAQRMACHAGLVRTSAGGWTLAELGERLGVFAGEFPELDEVQNDHAYIQLLLGRNVAEAADTARRLLRKRPELLAYRTTAALATLREQGRQEVLPGALSLGAAQTARVFQPDAAALYDGWTIDWKTAQDRYKAVHVAALRAAGRVFEAQQVADLIQAEALRPEERQLAGLP
jgi:tetratricopeptide (TPR) repeat protein